VKIKKVKLLVEQKIYVISSSCPFVCPVHPFSPKVVCCLKSVYYKDISLWRVSPRNIIDSLYTFLWGTDLSLKGNTLGVIAQGVDTLLPISIVKWKSVMRVSQNGSNQNIVLNSR
jgi:hypothetical protein